MEDLTERQLFNMAFNLSAEFGDEFTLANKDFAMAVIREYQRTLPDESALPVAQAVAMVLEPEVRPDYSMRAVVTIVGRNV